MKKREKLIDILFSIFIIIFPFIIVLETRKIDPSLYNLYDSNMGLYYDFILLARQKILIIFTLIIILIFLIDKRKIKISNIKKYLARNKVLYIFIIIYLILLNVSSIINYNSYFTFLGGYLDGEGIITINCYMIILIISSYYYKNNNLKLFKTSIKILIILFLIFSIIEKLNINLMNIEFIKKIILINEKNITLNSINIIGNKLQLFFGNSGYFSWLLILFFPYVLSFLNDKKNKLLNYIIILSSIWMIIETSSTTTFYIMLINIILCIMLSKNKKEYMIIIIFITLTLSFNNKYNVVLNKENKEKNATVIDMIIIKKDKIIFKNGNESILFDKNSKNNKIKYYQDFNIYKFDLGYNNTINFEYKEKFYLLKNYSQLNERKFSYNTKYLVVDKIFTGRGYIWRNSIKYIKNNLFLGKGPNSFIYEFNNNDYLGILNSQNSTSFYILKPHSMYLQMIFTSGLLSLIIFLILIFYIIIKFLKLEEKKELIYIFVGIINYLIFGLLNDSIVCVAPYFYIFIGILYSKIDNINS